MKISELLATHQALLEQTRLANLAQAYATLRRLAERVRRTGLNGLVNLRQPNAAEERFWASLTALEGSQSVIEEHFRDEELMEFADAVAFARGITNLDITFRLEAMTALFVVPLEFALDQAGVVLDLEEGEAETGPGEIGDLGSFDRHRGETPNQR
jgi:hypothetical protein